MGISGSTVVTATTGTTGKLCIVTGSSVNDLVHSCRKCKFVLPHFDCFVSDMEWLVDITETNEEGMFFLVVIGYFCKVISQAAQARDEVK